MSAATIIFVGGIKAVISMGVVCSPRIFATEPERGPIPVVHTVELLDWADGGPLPDALANLPTFAAPMPQAAE